MAIINPELLAKVPPLSKGAHQPGGAMCILEAVAYVAGEPWSDHPSCACPVISHFLRTWNDSLPDGERDALLRPLIPRIVGTKADAALEYRRCLMAADWLIREHTPTWLQLAGLTEHADALAGSPEIIDMAQVPSLRTAIEAARFDVAAAASARGGVARATSPAIARAAAWVASSATAMDPVGDGAGVATSAVAGDAAMAGRSALNPTRIALQQSALRLVDRMIEAGR